MSQVDIINNATGSQAAAANAANRNVLKVHELIVPHRKDQRKDIVSGLIVGGASYSLRTVMRVVDTQVSTLNGFTLCIADCNRPRFVSQQCYKQMMADAPEGAKELVESCACVFLQVSVTIFVSVLCAHVTHHIQYDAHYI